MKAIEVLCARKQRLWSPHSNGRGSFRFNPNRDYRVYHFSPLCKNTRQESPGVLRAEGKLLHPCAFGVGSACAPGSVPKAKAGLFVAYSET